MHDQHAQELIKQAIVSLMAQGRLLSPPEDGRYYVLGIDMLDGRTGKIVLGKRSAEELQAVGCSVTVADIERLMSRRDHFPVVSVVRVGTYFYSEVTELGVKVSQVGAARPFEGGP